MSPRAAPVAYPSGTYSGLSQPRVENGTIPASSHTSPTSAIRSTSSPHASQRILIASTHGRRSSSSSSTGPVARSSSSAFDPTTFSCPQAHG